jgi:hypothetical protein
MGPGFDRESNNDDSVDSEKRTSRVVSRRREVKESEIVYNIALGLGVLILTASRDFRRWGQK